MDLGKRAHDHSYRIDPIARTLLDTDFYKLLMLQFVWRRHRNAAATFSLVNRTRSARLADEVPEAALREQLDHARTLRFTKGELVWLQGNTFYGKDRIFAPDFVAWLADFRLPDYSLRATGDGQYDLSFSGTWAEASMWEIHALAIINELRARRAMDGLGRFELDLLYARAKSRLWGKVERLRTLAAEGPLKVGDFGTRRRHGFLWQRWCCEALSEGLGDSFVGTSNVHLAKEFGFEAIGTNAHELPMAYAAMAGDDPAALRASRYGVLSDWAEEYGGRLLVLLPDAYGTTAFLRDAPEWVASWSGARPDSKPPIEGGEEFVSYWRSMDVDPRDKLLVFSDGMDVDSIEETARHFRGRVGASFGWGTNLTNDFAGCAPSGAGFEPISLVCKLSSFAGRPAVKLSDNPSKATGDRIEIERYREAFGTTGMSDRSVRV